MISLLFLGYFFVVALLLIATLRFVFLLTVNVRKKDEWGPYAIKLILSAIPFVFLTWPILAGRLIYETQCSVASGLSINRTVNASTTGYFLFDSSDTSSKNSHYSHHEYAHQALVDLITGKIAFFEGYSGNHQSPFIRVYLSNKHSRECKRDVNISQGIELPDGKCFAERKIEALESKYEIRGYSTRPRYSPDSVSIIDRSSNEKLATYKTFSLSFPFFGSKHCPTGEHANTLPLHAISTAALQNSDGKAFSISDYDDIKNKLNKIGLHHPREIPPRELTTPKETTSKPKCNNINFGEDFDLHKISLYKGGGRLIRESLDASNNKVHEVRIIVNNPNHKTVLFLDGYDPILWSISRTPGSEISGVVVHGYHGQAVIGVESSTPVLISTYHYSPIAYCQIIQSNLPVATSNLKSYTENIIVVGRPDFQENTLLTSTERSLEDYVVH